MGALPRSASAILRQGRPPRPLGGSVRPCRAADLPALEALVAPHVAAGALLPRVLVAEEFLVAEAGGRLVGCVGLKAWTEEVLELGSLVSEEPGLGRRLVEAALLRAREAGARQVVALTGVGGFFLRCGFTVQADPPWARARGLARPVDADPELAPAVAAKARTCAGCARLGACRQDLYAFDLRAVARAAA